MRSDNSSYRILAPWQECIGVFKGKSDLCTQFILTLLANGKELQLLFHNPKEIETLRETMGDLRVGENIGILKTDLPSKPLLIKKINLQDDKKV